MHNRRRGLAGQKEGNQGTHLGTGCTYEGIPLVHVGQHGVQGPNIQIGGLGQGEAAADGPVVHRPLHPAKPTLQDEEADITIYTSL